MYLSGFQFKFQTKYSKSGSETKFFQKMSITCHEITNQLIILDCSISISLEKQLNSDESKNPKNLVISFSGESRPRSRQTSPT